MLTKIIVGLVGVLVIGAGGYVYWEGLNGSPNDCRNSCPGAQAPIDCPLQSPSCCDLEASCTSQDGQPRAPEVLDVMPREADAQ